MQAKYVAASPHNLVRIILGQRHESDTDAENVYTVLTARVMRPDLFIIARVESDDAEHKLRRAGADRVVSPYQIGAVQMAQTAIRPAVVDFMTLATSSDNLELAMEEITVQPSSPLVNKSLLDANLRQRFGVIVVAIQHEDRQMDFNPEPDTAIRAGDKLVVLGGPAMLIGLGGGAASSIASGHGSEDLDFASVQRDNAEMQRRCQEVIDRCWALGDENPIAFIHDVGAGGRVEVDGGHVLVDDRHAVLTGRDGGEQRQAPRRHQRDDDGPEPEQSERDDTGMKKAQPLRIEADVEPRRARQQEPELRQ